MEENPTYRQVNAQFSRTVRMHLDRLLGSELVAANFQMDMAAIACLVLLAEREVQTEHASSHEGRFTHESLVKEISSLGFPTDGDLENTLEGLVRAGHVRIRKDGTIMAERPLLHASHLLDLVFPRMPGMNLVAYLVQTSEEVLSGRKDLTSGNRQLHQVLQMQGVPISRSLDGPQHQTPAAPRPKPTAASKAPDVPGRKKTRERSSKQQTILDRLRAAARSTGSRNPISGSRIISSGKHLKQAEEVKHSEEVPPIPQAFVSSEEPGKRDEDKTEIPYKGVDITETSDLRLPETSVLAESQPYQEDIRPTEETQPLSISGREPEEDGTGDPISRERVEEALTAPEGEKGITADEHTERRVTGFEGDSTPACPLCGQGRIEPHETPTGKLFYKCSREGCYFISWGKPHNLPCPRCGNPFMVENREGSGRIFLKCPRATCGCKQNLPEQVGSVKDEQLRDGREKCLLGFSENPKPRRKVVRKRVVRRKR